MIEENKVPSEADVAKQLMAVDGELRVNVIRVVAIFVFYGIELVNRHGLTLGFIQLPPESTVTAEFHDQITAMAAGWLFVCLAVWIFYRWQIFPSIIRFLTTGADVFFLAILLIVADGPQSPLAIAFFIIVCVAGLRQDLRLVWFATGACILGYLAVLANADWYRPQLKVPHYYSFIFVASLVFVGITIGQFVRRIHKVLTLFSQDEPA